MNKNIERLIILLLLPLMLMTSCLKEKATEAGLEPMIPEKRVELFTEKADDLYKLSIVWGEMKYFHPAVVSTDVDWDSVLMDKLGWVIESEDPDMDTFLLDWINATGGFTTNEYDKELSPDMKEYKADVDALYFLEDGTFSGDLSDVLRDLSETNIGDRKGSYADVTDLVPDFSREKAAKSADYPSLEDTLLSFFRLWNAVNYYYPYKEGMKSMKSLFYEYLDDFVLADTPERYALAVLSFTAELRDSHVQVSLPAKDLFGTHHLPFDIATYFDSYIVTSVWEGYEKRTEVEPGDILVSINGESIRDLKRERGSYISVSSPERTAPTWGTAILTVESPEDNEIGVIRRGTSMEVLSSATDSFGESRRGGMKAEILEGNIGYIDPGQMNWEKDLDKAMEKLKDTDGLIIDMREYPGTGLTGRFPSYFLKKDTEFCRATVPDPQRPGSWLVFDPEYEHEEVPFRYDEDIVLLINEDTVSHGEFSVMLLSRSRRATLMGTRTNGTDGDVTKLPIPGGFVVFTSLGIYEDDMDPTQRVGIEPDVIVDLDPRDLREGRDTQLEAALRYFSR